jgi:hypothetical protein
LAVDPRSISEWKKRDAVGICAQAEIAAEILQSLADLKLIVQTLDDLPPDAGGGGFPRRRGIRPLSSSGRLTL